jgi:hypothetical protein
MSNNTARKFELNKKEEKVDEVKEVKSWREDAAQKLLEMDAKAKANVAEKERKKADKKAKKEAKKKEKAESKLSVKQKLAIGLGVLATVGTAVGGVIHETSKKKDDKETSETNFDELKELEKLEQESDEKETEE